MKPRSNLLLLVLFALLAQYGIKLIASAPSGLENSISTEDARTQFRQEHSKRVRSYMNTSVNPCEDFYEYACGNFPNAITEDDSDHKRSNLLDIMYTLLDRVNLILKKEYNDDDDYVEEIKTAQKFLNTCEKTELWPIKPSPEFLAVLKEIGGFPAVQSDWVAADFDWFKMAAHLTRYGVDGPIKEMIYMDHPFPPYYRLPKFGFEVEAYLENIATNESPGYKYNQKVMKDLLTMYGVNDSQADIEIEDIFKFWNHTLTKEHQIKVDGNCEDLAISFQPFSRWKDLFEIVWNSTDFKYEGISSCPCDHYYVEFDQVVANHSRAAANYMALKFLHTFHPKLKSAQFQRTYCLKLVKRPMSLLMTHFYMKEFYSKEIETDIHDIIVDLKASLKKVLESSEWLDEETKKEAIEKVKTLRVRIGQVLDPVSDVLIKQIRELKPTDNHAENILQLARFIVGMNHYLYLHPEIETASPPDILDAVQVNAFHYLVDNSINVMAGILNPPAYHPHMPQSAKYGALGYILGHELTHGYDSSGSNFDANLTYRSWWSSNSSANFEERSECFVEHYSQYKVPELNRAVNGSKSKDENIADSGGLREAFAAYKKLYKAAANESKDEFERNESLPELNLSPEQVFFLSFAQLYCAKYTEKHYWLELDDEHPMDKYRVLGSLQNFEEFGKVYNCPAGSPMNPEKKCRVW